MIVQKQRYNYENAIAPRFDDAQKDLFFVDWDCTMWFKKKLFPTVVISMNKENFPIVFYLSLETFLLIQSISKE